MTKLVTSTARVRAPEPARRARALTAYFSRPVEAEWDPDHRRGHVVFRRGAGGEAEGTCDLLCGEGVLMLSLEAPAQEIEALEELVESGLSASAPQETEEPAQLEWVRNRRAV